MPTIIDSLLVTIGLDVTDYQKKQKEIAESSKKTKEAVTKDGKEIAAATAAAAEGFHKVALEAIALFAAFAGSAALKNFITDLISVNTQLGNLGTILGESPQRIDAWGKAAERVGGSAEATAGTFRKIASALQELHINGRALPNAFYRLEAWSKVNIDTEHGPAAFMEGLATAAAKLAAQGDGAQAAELLKNVGIDEGTIALMLRGGPALDAYVKSLEKLAPTPEQIKASEDLTASWVTFRQTLLSLANEALPALDKVLSPALATWSAWIEKNRDLINSKIDEVLTAAANALNSINWGGITDGLGTFATAADNVATAINKIAAAIEWLGRLDEESKNWAIMKFFNSVAQPGQTPFVAAPGKGNVGGAAPATVNQIPGIRPKNGPPGRAAGGPIEAGKTYMVGEHGPEPFTAGVSGTISPANTLSGDLQIEGRNVNRTNPVPVTLSTNEGGSENWLQTLGRWFSGGATGGGGGGGFAGAIGRGIQSLVGGAGPDGGPYNPAPGAPGQYRPIYKLGARDLSDAVVNKINGEATAQTQSVDAVINNMFNRLGTHTYGPSGDLQAVALAKGQYAGYRVANADRAAFIRERIKAIASGTIPDNTFGSNEYRAGSYRGPWYQHHANSPVVGGNRFAFNPKGGRGPYAPYEGMRAGAGAAAADQAKVVHRPVSHNVHVGQIVIHTQAQDAHGVAEAVKNTLKRVTYASTANYGLA